MPKRAAIAAALTSLAALIKATTDDGQIDAYLRNLEDMSPRALELAFRELERTSTIAALPSPGEIREVGQRLLREEWLEADNRRFREEMLRWREQAELIPADERTIFAMDLRKAYERIVRAQDERAEQKRQQILSERAQRKSEHERRLGIEFYLQLVRRARDEGWEWKAARKAAA